MKLVNSEFFVTICDLFRLGDAQELTITSVSGRANRLWRLCSSQAIFVLKEFRYSVNDLLWLASIRMAAEFEYEVWQKRIVLMPEPIRSKDGSLLEVIAGSRGISTVVRVHRWIEGYPGVEDISVERAITAGSLLRQIQDIGFEFGTFAGGKLQWWRWNPETILLRLREVGLIDSGTAKVGLVALSRAKSLIYAGEFTSGPWGLSHYDYKPENTIVAGDLLAVLDWDEAAICHPRLEAVESALHWARFADGDLRPELLWGFLKGYRDHGGNLTELRASDFAKWVASTVGWFDYLGRRALREFDDNDTEAEAAAKEVAGIITSLDLVLSNLERLLLLLNNSWSEA